MNIISSVDSTEKILLMRNSPSKTSLQRIIKDRSVLSKSLALDNASSRALIKDPSRILVSNPSHNPEVVVNTNYSSLKGKFGALQAIYEDQKMKMERQDRKMKQLAKNARSKYALKDI